MSTANTPQRLGAIDSQNLVYEADGGAIHRVPVRDDAVPDAQALLTLMERHNLAQLWVHRIYVASKRIEQWPLGTFWRVAEMTGWKLTPSASGHWVYAYRSGTYGARQLSFPYLDKRAPWADAHDASELLAALLLYRDVLGVPFRRSPGSTGTGLMRSLHSGARATELDTPDTPPPPAQSGTEVSWSWVRPLLPEELERRYVHGYDKNGMYLAACASLDLGVGAAAHLLEGAASDAYFLDRAPGYYRVVGGDSRLSLLPNPLTIHRRPALEGGFWVTRPTLELLYEVDTPLHIAEAWAWTQRHQYLQPWYKRLRDGRKQLMSRGDDDTPAQIALAALKNTYTQAIGWLDGSWDREKAVDGHAGILYRPDWRHAIIAQSNANLYRRVHKWGQSRDCDFHPFAWVTDCVYIASNEANPELACPPDMTLGTGLGQFKVHDSVPMARVRDALASEKPSLRGFFDALAATRRTAERVTV